MVIGLAIGLSLGSALDMIYLGPGMGLPIGLAIGAAIEEKYEKEGKIRPLTKKEKEDQEKIVKILLGTLVLGIIVALVAFFLL